MAGGEGGLTVLESPTYALALVFFVYLVISNLFENGHTYIVHVLEKRKKKGLLAAVQKMFNELTVLGFISLLLSVFQGPLGKICVSVSDEKHWTILGGMDTCNCCLAHTAGVSKCFAKNLKCGPDYCNCEGKDPSCLNPDYDYEHLVAPAPGPHAYAPGPHSYAYSPSGSHEATADVAHHNRHLLRSLLASESSSEEPVCDGGVTINEAVCPAGKVPATTATVLHQIHLFIFVIAVMHIVTAFVVYGLSALRIKQWGKWAAEEDDHAIAVRHAIEKSQKGKYGLPVTIRKDSHIVTHHHAQAAGKDVEADDNLSEDEADEIIRHEMYGEGSSTSATAPPPAEPSEEPQEELSPTETTNGVSSAVEDKGQDPAPQEQADVVNVDVPGKPSAPRVAERMSTVVGKLAATTGARLERKEQQIAQKEQELYGDQRDYTCDNGEASHKVSTWEKDGGVHKLKVHQQEKWLGRSHSIARTKRSWVKELVICFFMQFKLFRAISHEEFKVMRAAFLLTHKPGKDFNFVQYIFLSFEDDFAAIVGMSLEMWLTIILYILLLAPLPWIGVFILSIALALIVAVNIKVAAVVRKVTAGGHVRRLNNNVFWLKKPALLLHPIKFILFLASFFYSGNLFWLWQFGPQSCMFSASDKTVIYFPFWIPVIVVTIILLVLGTYTVPVYSIAVQLGSDYKHHMLPSNVKERLLQFAQRAKKNVSVNAPPRARADEAGAPDMAKMVEGGAAVAMGVLKTALVPHGSSH